jgi:UDPglucose 6-dehydrogenase
MEDKVPGAIKRIAVFGLGKLGGPIAGCHAASGFEVIGVDRSKDAVQWVDQGKPPVAETGIGELYAAAAPRLSATMDGEEAVGASDATLVVVPTPSNPDGSYSLRYVLDACASIGRGIRRKGGYHLVVLKSTVLPGSCDGPIRAALEQASGKRWAVDFGFCYNPEFIALGSVIRNILEPDLVLIGESDPAAGDQLYELYRQLLGKQPPAARLAPVNAELAKIALNTFVTMKITFANLLARLCEQLPGGEVDDVTAAIGSDSRIGPRYLKGGLGYGGPCFPRDNKALLALSRQLGLPFPLAEATDSANREVIARVAELTASHASDGTSIAVLGLSYKPDTAVIDESPGVIIARDLVERGFRVLAYDPMATEAARVELGDAVEYAESAQACIDAADLVLITTPWPEFASLRYSGRSDGRDPLVIDCWDTVSDSDIEPSRLVKIGRGPAR